MSQIEKDEVTGTDTTGHEWDGIKELNTPLPRWWILTFYATIVWAVGYMILYPAWPMINSATTGLLGYSSRAEVAEDIAAAQTAQAQWLDSMKSASLTEIVKDPDLLEFARAGGAAAFKVNCVQCHGAGAAGSSGFPNLNDNDWLWGGTIDQIHQTIVNGVRFEPNSETRSSMMPAFGVDGILTGEQISDVSNFVASLSGGTADAQAVSRGALVYVEGACASCHGEKGEGNLEFGGPSLTDQIALYGSSVEAITAQVKKPRHGVMPAWNTRLDEDTLKKLAVYVYSLGGGVQ